MDIMLKTKNNSAEETERVFNDENELYLIRIASQA